MPKITYIERTFEAQTLATIARANAIVTEYQADGLRLTLRQLYYQFVARGWLENKQREYTRLGRIVSDARLAGLLDWDAIEDRGRRLERLATWTDPPDILRSSAEQFRLDIWGRQQCRVEVWIEKEALLGVIADVCDEQRVPYFACRGYTSQSAMWEAGHQRLRAYRAAGQEVVILHLGDHDPSGLDMTRDIRERLNLFCAENVMVRRIALNMDQVRKYKPPPNPAKATDARFAGYVQKFGTECWELDALEPGVLQRLILKHVKRYREDAPWELIRKKEQQGRAALTKIADNW